jgi:foldase protein PrsA
VKKQQIKIAIAALIVLNIITITLLLIAVYNNKETVAMVGDDAISRKDWISEMEARYGEKTLKEMIDEKIIERLAKKYDISISEKDIEREFLRLKTSAYLHEENHEEEKLKQKIKNSLLLEELLTKDVVISKKAIQKYYEENKDEFRFPASYHLSQIVVKTKKEAEQTVKELQQGSSFSALAMERSIDSFSASQGGDIGYVTEEEERLPGHIMKKIKHLKPKQWTNPMKMDGNYVIFLLHENIPEKNYPFSEVRSQIRRQLALEQLEQPLTADVFWNEEDVDWIYGDKN